MKEFVVKCDNAPDFVFSGRLLAVVSSERKGDKKYSRWHELALYETESGRLVGSSISFSRKLGEYSAYRAEAFGKGDFKAVIGFFGQGWLSKELYEKAGIENVVRLD